MAEFNTSLVREKITFMDDGQEVLEDGGAGPQVIRSNRVFLHLVHKKATEKIVVRAQNMHTTLRLASKILYDYFRNGPFTTRPTPFDWQSQWDSVLSSYEKDFNPDIWAAVYINGQGVFKTTTSPFVDVIEKCALLTVDNYDATMEVTENALKQVGKAMKINHSSNIAAVFTDSGDQMRCGIIHRADGRDTTFNFTAAGGNQNNRVVQTMGAAAAFLEAINVRFALKVIQPKMRAGELEKTSAEFKKGRAALGRQGTLNKTISSYEEIYDVKYRPEKPDFFTV